MEELNGAFENAVEYFTNVLQFLTEYQWIFRSPNTHILQDDIVRHVPDHWPECLNYENTRAIEKACHGEIQESWPSDLRSFASTCRHFSLKFDDSKEFKTDRNQHWNKVNPKKIHEVLNFAQFISEHCRQNGIKHVVDVGSGLGYLDKQLSEYHHLNVLGLEQSSYRVAEANLRSREDETQEKAVFKEFTFTTGINMEEQLDQVLDEWFDQQQLVPNSPLCMVGLHACGDLSPTMQRLFLSSHRFRSMLLISCCYHRMTCNDQQSQNYFPLSWTLKQICDTDLARPFMEEKTALKYFFRLAAQETVNRWLRRSLQQKEQLNNIFYRAILQRYAMTEHIHLLKQHRKAVKNVNQLTDFASYIEQAVIGFNLKGHISLHKKKLLDIYKNESHKLRKVETLIILQALLQPVAESFILFDRITFMKENGVDCTLEHIFNDRISPRCFALTARKDS